MSQKWRTIPEERKIIGSITRNGVTSNIPPILNGKISIKPLTSPQASVGDGVSSACKQNPKKIITGKRSYNTVSKGLHTLYPGIKDKYIEERLNQKELDNDENFNSGGKKLEDNLPTSSLRDPGDTVLSSGLGGNKTNKSPELSNYQLHELVFRNIVDILEKNPINQDTQMKLERYVRNQFTEFIENKKVPIVLGINSQFINSKFNDYIHDKILELKTLLTKRKKLFKSKNFCAVDDIKSLSNKGLLEFILKDIFNNLKIEDFINICIYTLLFVVTHNNIFLNDEGIKHNTKTNLLNISLMMGEFIFNIYLQNIKNEVAKNGEKIQYSKLKDETIKKYIDGNRNLTLSEIYLHIGSYLIEVMRTSKMVDLKIYKSEGISSTILILDNLILDLMGNNVNRAISIPFNLPMIVKPRDYSSENSGGGYLLNDVEYFEPLINKKFNYKTTSEIEQDNKLYYTLNKMMATPFKINKELLNHLVDFNHIYKLLIDPDFQHEFANISRNKHQEKEYQRFLSKKLLEEYIIKIAQTFSSVPEIFFPIRLDQRGRLYPRTVYFHYQSSELAKALLLFSKPDYIERGDIVSVGYLKAYGASCFGNGLNKKSYEKRID